MSQFNNAENKYDDEPRLPTFEEALTQERLLMERSQLMEATKQLARLQMDMETRVRAEMEMKIRAEMEAKMVGEIARMEEERKAEEERRALEAMKSEKREKVLEELRKLIISHPSYQYPMDSAIFPIMMEFVEKNKVMSYSRQMVRGQSSNELIFSYAIYFSETQIGIHIIMCKHGGSTYQEVRPIYCFDSELTRRDLTIWNNIEDKSSVPHPFTQTGFQTSRWWFSYVVQHLASLYAVSHRGHSFNQFVGSSSSQTIRKSAVENGEQHCSDFQTIVRLIPGHYKNGPWRPLDGFFGPYLNEETLEIISLVPLQE